jgi:hypothetical protein
MEERSAFCAGCSEGIEVRVVDGAVEFDMMLLVAKFPLGEMARYGEQIS